MAKPFNPELQEAYTQASRLVRTMDQLDGGFKTAEEAVKTACFALEAGLITAELFDGKNSCFDALVMLHELLERNSAK